MQRWSSRSSIRDIVKINRHHCPETSPKIIISPFKKWWMEHRFLKKFFFLLFHKWPRFTLEKVPLGNVIKVSYSYISVISIEVIFHFSLIITSWAKLRSLRIPFIFVVFVLFSLREDVSSYRDFFFMQFEDVISNESNV